MYMCMYADFHKTYHNISLVQGDLIICKWRVIPPSKDIDDNERVKIYWIFHKNIIQFYYQFRIGITH